MSGGRLLGIDHGVVRIGVAVSDALRLIARELAIIERRSRQEDFEHLNQLAAQENVVGVIVGMPSAPDDADGHTQADTVRLWVERYAATTHLPIVLWDEHLTSADAQALARQQKRKFRQPIDDLAARLILQSYLDALRDGLAPPIDAG